VQQTSPAARYLFMMIVMRPLLVLIALHGAVAHAQAGDHPAEAMLLADVASIEPGAPFQVGIRFRLQPGWHIYWINPGDAGQPPEVNWQLPEGFTASPLAFPLPKRFEQAGNIVGYGYEDDVLLMGTITPPRELEVGTEVTLSAEVTWLVCEDVCIPGKAHLELDLPVTHTARPTHRDVFKAWADRLPRTAADASNVSAVHAGEIAPGKDRHTLTIDWKSAPAPDSVQWFPPPSEQISFTEIEVSSEGPRTTVSFVAEPFNPLKVQQATLDSVLAYHVDGQRRGLVVPLRILAPPDAAANVSDRSIVTP
jgi:DsbC/DsbD-like thiol-disulfide interchange protein